MLLSLRQPLRLIAAIAWLAACGSTTAPSVVEAPRSEPPPRGASFDDYLRSGRPTRPADTDDRAKMTLHTIDIGQGLAVLAEFPCGAVLIDTGGEENSEFHSNVALGQYLDKVFARRKDLGNRLDALIITHPHIDHTRGVELILDEYQVSHVVTNGQEIADLGGNPQIRLHRWARKRASRRHRGFSWMTIDTVRLPPRGITNSIVDPVGRCKNSDVDPVITALWGQVNDVEDFSENANDHSIVLRIDFGEASALITGDLEFEGLERLNHRYQRHLDLLDVDVYIVGHHGARNATAPHLVRAMTPKIALISAGPYERNVPWTARKYGHPNLEAIDKLRNSKFGVSWFRDSKETWVGVKGAWRDRDSVFKRVVINRAIYSTSWDGSIRTDLYDNGWLEVKTEHGN